MYFAPTDEEVELMLGPLLGSWPASPLREVINDFHSAARTQNVLLSVFIVLSLFAFAFCLAYLFGSLFGSSIVGAIALLISGVGALVVIGKIGAISVEKARLGVFEKGLRLGGSIVRFDELASITFGAPESFEEKFFPTFRRFSEYAAELKVGREEMQQVKEVEKVKKDTSITFHFQNGKTKSWPAFGLYFEAKTYDEFLHTLDETVPSLIAFPNEMRDSFD